MDKQEALQVHALLFEVATHFANKVDDVNLGQSDLERYNELNIKPTDIHRKRKEHEDAVAGLSKDITDVIGDTQEGETTSEQEEIVA